MTTDEAIRAVDMYCAGVLSGRLPACVYVRKAVERYRSDLGRDDLYMDWQAFGKMVKVAQQFKHYKGPLAGQYFVPEPWQLFVFANIIGLKRKDTGLRKYRLSDIYLPRKNGKTYLAAIFAAWFCLMDGEAGPEVYTAALDKDQAKICYEAVVEIIRNSIFAECVKIYNSRDKMQSLRNSGVLKPLSRDTRNKDGLNVHAAICDERHAWPNTEMLDVIKTGMGARTQPHVMSISTAGVDVSYPYYRDIEDYKAELLGAKPLEDDHFFLLYTLDEGDDWESEESWRKANPNYGVSLSADYMRRTYEEAKIRGGSYAVTFQVKDLNLWTDAPKVWISDEDVAACNYPMDESQLKDADCYVGIDLASKVDICAVAYFFPRLGNYVKMRMFVPQSKLSSNEDRVDYRKWEEDGWLTVCGDRVLDEDLFMSLLLDDFRSYNVKYIAYDPWGMYDLKTRFGRYEDKLLEYRQDIRHMSVPTKRLESEVLRHNINFGGNPIMRWMMRNVVVYVDPNANIKLDKSRSREKIDGVVALVDAIGAWLNDGDSDREIYGDYDLRTI